MNATGDDLIRIPRAPHRALAGWRLFCPACDYSHVFLAREATEADGLVTLPTHTCARCHRPIEVAGVPIETTGTIRGCCRKRTDP